MAPAITIAMATGANLRRARATVTMMHGRSDVVLAAIAKNQIKTGGTATAILAWLTAIATIENAIARSRMHSPDMFTCLADQSASSCTTAIANTHYAAPNPGRSRPLVHSGWSPVVISALRHAQGAPSLSRGETTMGVRLIRGLVTRPVSPRGDVERLMLLDAVLAVGDVEWLTAAAEKAAYLEGLKAKATDDRPQEPTSDEVRPRPSSLPSAVPIAVAADGRTQLRYLASEPTTETFRTFLQTHAELLRVAPTWTIRIVFPRPLDHAYDAYQAVTHEELESPLHPVTISGCSRTLNSASKPLAENRCIP